MIEREVDLIIADAAVLAVPSTGEVLTHTSIAIDEGEIVDIGSREVIETKYRPARRLEASGRLALPGLINGHTHLFQVMCRGLGDGHDLSTWNGRAIWPIAEALDPAACRVAATLSCIELIESGTTTVVDSHFLHKFEGSHDAVAEGCLATGIRAVLCRACMDTGPVPAAFLEPPQQAVAATERFIETWHGRANRLLARPEAMSEATASATLILALREVARRAHVDFHMHAAEARSRPEHLQKTVGFRTVEYLDHLGVLGEDVVLAHAVWVTELEIEALRRTRTNVVHNPISNQFLADGVAPVPAMLQRGIRIALGSDGAASNDALDMFEVMKSAALLHKISTMRANVLGAKEILSLCTDAGAHALGMGDLVGTLEPGKRADILLVKLVAPRMVPWHSIISNVVYSASSRNVDTVIVEGRIVAEGGQCVTVDRDAIAREAMEIGARLGTSVQRSARP